MTGRQAYDALIAALPGEPEDADSVLFLCDVVADSEAAKGSGDSQSARLAAGARAWLLYLDARQSVGDSVVMFKAGDVTVRTDLKAAARSAQRLYKEAAALCGESGFRSVKT